MNIWIPCVVFHDSDLKHKRDKRITNICWFVFLSQFGLYTFETIQMKKEAMCVMSNILGTQANI